MKSIRKTRPRCSPALAPSDGERVAAGRVRGRPRFAWTDRGDIFINEGVAQSDGALNWTGTRKVNIDGTATDQWNPAVAVNPAGTQLFVGYYSRQDDPNNNALIKAYGVKVKLAPGFANALFDPFPIRNTAFTTLFPGTLASTPHQNWWMYDHVWMQTDVCLETDATVAEPCNPVDWQLFGNISGSAYQHFNADDYTWSSADSTYFYYAWCDRAESYSAGGHTRPDANIRLGKVKQ
jgi:hypothetical protein